MHTDNNRVHYRIVFIALKILIFFSSSFQHIAVFLFTIKQGEITEKTTKLSCLDVYKHIRLHRNETVFTAVSELHLEVNFSVQQLNKQRDLHELYKIAFTINCLPSMSDKPLAIYCSCGAVQYGSSHHPVMTTVLSHHDFGTMQRLTGYIFFAVLMFSSKTKCTAAWHG